MFLRPFLQHAFPVYLVALLFMGTIVGSASTVFAMAEEDMGTEAELTTDEVYVTAGRVAKQLLDVPMSVSVITEDEVRKSTVGTVGELLRDVPGVQLRSSGGQGFNRISIRGESPNRVLILIDGQKIAENKSMEGPPLLIDPSRIERIEVIRGPASVLYGSEAIGGVVNIITKKGGGKPIAGEVGTFYSGANDGTGAYASLFGSHKGFNYCVSGAYADHNDRRVPGGTAHNSDFRQTDASAFLSYDFEKLTIGGGYEYFDSTLHAGDLHKGYENFQVNLPKWKLQKYSLFVESKNLTPWLPRVRFDAFTQKNQKHMINIVDVDAMPLVVTNEADNVNRQQGVSAQIDWLLHDNHYLITGYELNHDTIDAETDTDNVIKAMGRKVSKTHARHEGTQTTHAVFAQMESTLPADFTLNYGMRYTWVRSNMKTAHGTKTDMRGQVSPYDVGETGKSAESRPVFNVGIMWSGLENTTLRATFSQGFRAPNLNEQYIISSMGGGIMVPNPDLKPEKSNSYEIGGRYAGDKLTLDVAAFYSDADDYIAKITTDKANKIQKHENVASAKTHGVEVMGSYDLPYGLTPYVNATWMKRKYDFGDRTTWNTGDPQFTGRSGVRGLWELDTLVDLRLDVYGRFHSRAKSETSEGEITHLAGWGTANISAGVDFGKEKEYSVNAEVQNIFNKKYRTSSAIFEPGVHANVNFSMRF